LLKLKQQANNKRNISVNIKIVALIFIFLCINNAQAAHPRSGFKPNHVEPRGPALIYDQIDLCSRFDVCNPCSPKNQVKAMEICSQEEIDEMYQSSQASLAAYRLKLAQQHAMQQQMMHQQRLAQERMKQQQMIQAKMLHEKLIQQRIMQE